MCKTIPYVLKKTQYLKQLFKKYKTIPLKIYVIHQIKLIGVQKSQTFFIYVAMKKFFQK